MKQFNVDQQVFDDLIVEQVQMPIDVPIEIHQIVAGKPVITRIETSNTINVPRFSTYGAGWVYVPEELIDDVSASVTGGGDVWLDGDQIKCSGAQPTPAHSFDRKTGKWVLDKNKQAELDAQAEKQAAEAALVNIKQALQAHIDGVAHSLGFTDGNSVMLYTGFNNPFRALAEAFGAWEAGIWVLANEHMALVKAGKKAMPTLTEVVGMIPAFVPPSAN